MGKENNPAITPAKKRNTELSHVWDLFNSAIGSIKETAGNNRPNQDYFDFQPYGARTIYDILSRIREKYPDHKKFLDVGCGIGNILSIARILGFQSTGIEYNEAYHQYLINPRTTNVEWMDAFDFEKYYDYDIIYLYRPISNNDKMRQLMLKIVKEMRNGALIIPIGCDPFGNHGVNSPSTLRLTKKFVEIKKVLGGTQYVNNIYQKV